MRKISDAAGPAEAKLPAQIDKQAPNHKHQITNKDQITSTKVQTRTKRPRKQVPNGEAALGHEGRALLWACL
jgi:hypothetical protein